MSILLHRHPSCGQGRHRLSLTPEVVASYEVYLKMLLDAPNRAALIRIVAQSGMTTPTGRPITMNMFDYRCRAAFLGNPDKWRSAIERKEMRPGDDPLTDDEWNRHVMNNVVRFVYSDRKAQELVFELLRSDPERWKPYQEFWQGKRGFETFTWEVE